MTNRDYKPLQYYLDNNLTRLLPAHVKEQIVELTPLCKGDLRERIYWLRHGLTEYPTCPYCANSLSTQNFIRNGPAGYRTYCSIKCTKQDQDYTHSISKRKATNLERYGSSNPWYFVKFRQYLKERFNIESILNDDDLS